jgi:hypothetical protein
VSSVGHIYGLLDPRTGELRYVGRTRQALQRRLLHHLQSKDQTHRTAWIQSLVRDGVRPEIILIEEVPVLESPAAERRWIANYRSAGARLVNCTDGGEGCLLGNRTTFRPGRIVPKTVREKISRTTRGRPPNHVLTDASRAKMSAVKIGKKRGPTPDHVRRKQRESQLGQKRGPLSDDHRQLLSRIRSGKPWSAARRRAEDARRQV